MHFRNFDNFFHHGLFLNPSVSQLRELVGYIPIVRIHNFSILSLPHLIVFFPSRQLLPYTSSFHPFLDINNLLFVIWPSIIHFQQPKLSFIVAFVIIFTKYYQSVLFQLGFGWDLSFTFVIFGVLFYSHLNHLWDDWLLSLTIMHRMAFLRQASVLTSLFLHLMSF